MQTIMSRNAKAIITVVAIATIFPFFSFHQKFDLKASIARGKEIYTVQCLTCHMEAGEGLESVYPPLAKSDYLMADKKRSIQQILHGASGEMKVNGVTYNGEMPAITLTDEEVSDVLNYVRNSWGNKGEAVKPEEVKALRK
jgi:mono/diheme cytochrome c family protein